MREPKKSHLVASVTKEPEKINEEQRKLQVTGGSTFILSLPKEWAIKNDLKRGSSMLVREEVDGSLCIMPSSFPKQEKHDEAYIRVGQSENPDAIMRTAISAYLSGYNVLHVKAQGQKLLSSKTRNHLKNFARNYLVGTEIVIDTPSELTLQVLLNYPELTVQNALSRMSIISSSMHKEAIGALKKLDYSNAKAVIETDREVNRFALYIVRLLKLAVSNQRIVKEIGIGSQRECLGYRLIAKSVERTADHATKIAENTLQLKDPVNEQIIQKLEELSGLANSMFEHAMESLFKHDYNLAEAVIERLSQVHELEKETVLSLSNAKTEEIVDLRLIIESIRRTAEYACDISEVVLNMNVESVLV
ncbi:MAG TPA: phosphate uptake regulator PhoU [Candidatus Acidoferrales bacterium]|nr:phosphate uptake regulator PhoU [Candidatus Acidoferrales bacterium]